MWTSTFNVVKKIILISALFCSCPNLTMEEQDVPFRHILLYHFRKGKNASQAQMKLCTVNWFARFDSGDFSLKNAERFFIAN